MRKCLLVTGGVLAVLLAVFVGRFLMVARPFHLSSLQYSPSSVLDQCVLLSSAEDTTGSGVPVDVIGAEDIVPIGDGLAIASSNDNMFQWVNPRGSPSTTPPGHLFLLDTRGATPKLSVLPLKGFPDRIPFHPHGIYYDPKRERLFVVNHAYREGGERVELFTVQQSSADQYQARYLRTVRSKAFDAFAMGNLNDVISPFENELYVTVYRAFPDPLEGRQAASPLVSALLDPLAFIMGSATFVYQCRFEERAGATEFATCAVVADHLGMANGIAHSADRSELFVSDMPNWRLARYLRDSDTGRLSRNGHVSLPHAVDNLELDRESGAFYGGSVPSFLRHIAFTDSDGAEFSPGGSLRIELLPDGSARTHDLIMQDGSLISGVSCGPKIGKYVVLGSWAAPGILVCPFSESDAIPLNSE
mmetsp:Transcript_46409/g.116870  ORF Transcript_46409/g.116870 Transcript_46409/m.116870 type:complete len:418 (+) Transcript_46409:89-1342(+)|eukprot:CAMPEP_0177651456 /NCGR_PEP_ID=MMETSP0447-20121125/12557_1 /TAXON_ID=0 /ORGANISM="Stygamoeba regulata, Strain BSH-02190019" /LENGTH=417 /DNA_ID=CAMNT_0019154537 /DNA_START=136 /DNA_END=1389 /DNA_ORIENTATION=+